MWICNRCQTANKDGYTQCVQCSAPRNARRFGAGTPVATPSVQALGQERRMQPAPEEQPAPSPRRQAVEAKPQAPRTAGGLVRLVGRLLAVLLPLLVLLLAVLRHTDIKPVIEGLFFGQAELITPAAQATGFVVDAAQPLSEPAQAFSPILSWLAYGASTLVAALNAAVPGLTLYALGHIARGVRKP